MAAPAARGYQFPQMHIDQRLRIGPRTYLLIGVVLFVLKFVIDHSLARWVFARPWSIYNYLVPHDVLPIFSADLSDRNFYLAMLLIALPFIATGILVTRARLRDANMPAQLLILFFVPFVNLLFFIMLGFLPTARAKNAEDTEIDEHLQQLQSRKAELLDQQPHPAPAQPLQYAHDNFRQSSRPLASLFPIDKKKSAAVAILLPIPFAALLTLLAATVFRNYGWGIFVGLPFGIGMVSAILHGYRVPRTAGECTSVACLSLLACGIALFSFAIEGLGCLIMLAPLAFPIAMLGALMGYTIQAQPRGREGMNNTLWSISLSLPILIGAESLPPRHHSTFTVTTIVEVNAPPQEVWHNVVTFGQLPEPTELPFRAGVAYPVRAHIDGTGIGAIRHCEFSTGAFVEPITVWDQPHRLAFDVTSNPPPMREWSFFEIHPPHLENFLISHHGEFRLIELPNNRTRLEGTTWYEHRLFPEAYWRLWSDYLIHKIHTRVLNHVKTLSEVS